MRVTLTFDDESKDIFYDPASGAGTVRMKITNVQDPGRDWVAACSIRAYSLSDGSLLGNRSYYQNKSGSKTRADLCRFRKRGRESAVVVPTKPAAGALLA